MHTSEHSALTVLICTNDRAALLLRTLEYLNAARRPENYRVEVLVAANACIDDTLERLARFRETAEEGLLLSWITEPTPGKSHALNRAIPLIRSELVAFVDDDHRVDADYLVSMCRAAERYPEADFFCGRILPDWDGTEPEWVHDRGPFRIYPLPVPRFDQGHKPKRLTPEIATPGGGNLFLRRVLFDRVGDFSPEFGPRRHDLGGSEDMHWVLRAQALGATLQYVPEVVQYHYVDPERLRLIYLIKKAYKRSSSVVRVANAGKVLPIPMYMYRKVAKYLAGAVFSLSFYKRRFYLVRLAAALGEIKGYLTLRVAPNG